MNINTYNVSRNNALQVRASTGWLLKWNIGNKWLKSPGFLYEYMYESYAEIIASAVASDLGIKRHIKYIPCILVIDGIRVLGCESLDYTNNNKEYTFKKLAELGYISDITNSGELGYNRLIKEIKNTFNINIRGYLEDIILLDSIILNTDRNPWNMSILYNADNKKAVECPIYDSGSSLGLDGLHSGIFEYEFMYDSGFRAAPFDVYFENQIRYIRNNRVYKSNLELTFKLISCIKYNFSDNNTFNVVNTLSKEQLQYVITLLKARQQSILMHKAWKN